MTTTPMEALRSRESGAGTGALILKSRKTSATIYFRNDDIYAIQKHGEFPAIRQRLKWSIEPTVHEKHVYEVIVSTPPQEVGKALLDQNFIPATVITEVARDYFLQTADEVLLAWGSVEETWQEGEELPDTPGLTIPPYPASALIKRVEDRTKRIQAFASWLKIDLYEVGSITLGEGTTEPSLNRDAERLVSQLAPHSPTLVTVMQESGGMGMSQIVSAVYRLYQEDGIRVFINNREVRPDKSSAVASTALKSAENGEDNPPVSKPHKFSLQRPKVAPRVVEEVEDTNVQAEIEDVTDVEEVFEVEPTPSEAEEPINDSEVTEKEKTNEGEPAETSVTEEINQVNETLAAVAAASTSPDDVDIDALFKQLEAMVPKLQARRDALVTEIRDLREDITQKTTERDNIERERGQIKEYMGGMQSRMQEEQDHINKLQAELAERQANMAKMNEDVSVKEDRDNELVARHRHFSDSLGTATSLLEQKEKEEADLGRKISRLS